MKRTCYAVLIFAIACLIGGVVQNMNYTASAGTSYPPGQGGSGGVSSSNIFWFTNVVTGEIYNTNTGKGIAVSGPVTVTGGDFINGGWGALQVLYSDSSLHAKGFANGTGAFTNNGSGGFGWFPLSGIASTATNLGTLVFPTNAGAVSFIDLPIAGATAGTAEGYALQLAGTNMLEVIGFADATTVTNPFVRLAQGNVMVHTNSQASWPKIPTQAGAFCIVSSNGLPYILLSTNNAGGGSTTWTGTNKFGW